MNNLYNETKLILKKYGISANKNLGQNFLVNEEVVEGIIEGAQVTKQDLVIEIGPGLGTLTKRLLETAGKVIAIELDKRMIEILSDRFSLYDNFDLINADVLKVDLNRIIEENLKNRLTEGLTHTNKNDDNIKNKLHHAKIVANLPYYITTPIIMKLLEEKIQVESITVMIQKEVADRIIAFPSTKNSGAITYSVYYYAEAEKILEVMPNSFIPEPSVNSEVISLKIRKEYPVKVQNEEILFKIIKQAFMQRRKTFVNALSNSNIFSNKEEILNILENLKIKKDIRGAALTLENYADICNLISES